MNLNFAYMRALRRIAGKPKFDKDSAATKDHEIRASLAAPSLYALLARRRLQLLSSMLCSDTPLLPALLATTVVGTAHGALPWMELVLEDMAALHTAVRPRLDALGDPWLNGHRWSQFIIEWPSAWRRLVALFAPTSTAADSTATKQRMPLSGDP